MTKEVCITRSQKKNTKSPKKKDSLKLTAKAPENRLFQKERMVLKSIHFQVQTCCKFQGGSCFTTFEFQQKKNSSPFRFKKGTSQKGATLSLGKPHFFESPWRVKLFQRKTSLLGQGKHPTKIQGKHFFGSHFQPLLLGSPAYACQSIRWSTLTWGSKLCQVFQGMKNQVQ